MYSRLGAALAMYEAEPAYCFPVRSSTMTESPGSTGTCEKSFQSAKGHVFYAVYGTTSQLETKQVSFRRDGHITKREKVELHALASRPKFQLSGDFETFQKLSE